MNFFPLFLPHISGIMAASACLSLLLLSPFRSPPSWSQSQYIQKKNQMGITNGCSRTRDAEVDIAQSMAQKTSITTQNSEDK